MSGTPEPEPAAPGGDGGSSDDDGQPDDAGASGTLGEHLDPAELEEQP